MSRRQQDGRASRRLSGGNIVTPKTIFGSALAWWFDSSMGVTQAGTVSQILDQSGNSRTFSQATAGKRPTYNATDSAFAGRPSIQHIAASATFLQAAAFNLGTYTVYLVATGLSTASQYFWARGAATDDYLFGNSPAIFSVIRDGSGASAWSTGATWGDFGTTPKTIRVEMGGTHVTHKGYLNGVSTFTTSVIATDPGTGVTSAVLNIGDDGAGGAPADFKWASFVGVVGVASAAQSTAMENYLRARYGHY
jgi:hypothetical protein